MSRRLLRSERAGTLLIDVLGANVKAKKFRIHDFVVMPDHLHLLITVDRDLTIEKAMQLIKGGFSFRLKKELGYAGEVWQRGFRKFGSTIGRVSCSIVNTSRKTRRRQDWQVPRKAFRIAMLL
jgi:REP element-mobilizing transposase RayT